MGDSVVIFLLEYLSARLKEAIFVDGHGVEDKVNSLHADIRLLNIFLMNCERKRNDEMVKEVVRQIREVANEAENVIDSYIQKVAEHQRRSFVGRIFRTPFHTRMLRDVGRKILGIKEKMKDIYNNKERYGIEFIESTVNPFEEEAIHRYRREVEEDDVVGFIADITTLVQQLTGGNLMRDVISIIGMAGLGKTTLAWQVYNRICAISHFDCHAWVYVSLNFKTRDLLLKILEQMQTPDELRRRLESMSEDELKKELFKYLQDKRYLVVMDDIWRTEVWDDIGSVFPNNCNGSRILITSRNKEVALHASYTTPHYLPPLSKDESWELFSKKVFRQETCPLELETFGRQIAESCSGLPLSIVVLAGLLATKEKSLHIWLIFLRRVTSFLITREDDTTICQKILSLSYTDLPRRLKPCFLYFGIFPEDFEIPVRRLMQLWVAEGFIEHTGHRIPEDVAEIYLEELIDRSLIQVVSKRTDGGAKTCRIHDLLRELCISESAEEMFLEVQSENHLETNKSRRLSIHGNSASRYMAVSPSVPTNARSLFFFASTSNDHTTWTWVQKHFKFLRVLYFEKFGIPVVPKSIATLIHLRYLTVQFHHPSGFPNSIGNLTNLQTLCFKGNLCEGCLPKEIFKLQRLKNLYLPRGLLLPCDSEEALVNLQVLSIATIEYDAQKYGSPIVLDKFPNVRKLKILIKGPLKEMPEAEEIISFPSLQHSASLEILRIENCGMLLGNLNPIPSSITKLTLVGVVLKVDGCMTVLEKLPRLLILKLEEDHHLSDTRMHVNADSFLQLQVLKLRDLRIEEWKLERRAMPRLRHLVIERCDIFTSPPELLSLTTLRYVEVIHCPRLATMLRELQTDIGFKLLIKD